ncbi:MAG: 2Fe-2S iron-sulfur cluster-binding protein, partial [Defluviitaleaceae bacterium]|nr:2Fe-2S iron-sulfur cluster-binding protein [Defluviitaleaceae bacterium]
MGAKMEKNGILVSVKKSGGPGVSVVAEKGATLLEALRENGFYVPAACGGRGSCGKCAVKIIKNAPRPCREDEKNLSGELLAEGYRLACATKVSVEMEIELIAAADETSGFKILEAYEAQRPAECDRYREMHVSVDSKSLDLLAGAEIGLTALREFAGLLEADAAAMRENGAWCLTDGETIYGAHEKKGEEAYGIAVDVGTTTVAFELVELTRGRRVSAHSKVNRQRQLGADVITRIQLASSGKLRELGDLIKRDIES